MSRHLALALALAACGPPPAPPPAPTPPPAVVKVDEATGKPSPPLPPPMRPVDCAAETADGAVSFCAQTIPADATHVACHMPSQTTTAPLACLPELRSLTLRGTRVARLDGLRPLRHLRRLNLSHTRVVDLEPLAALPALRELALDGTPVVDLSPLGDITALDTLRMRGAASLDADSLAALPSLRKLDLVASAVDHVRGLGDQPDLVDLALPDTVDDLAPLAGAARLHTLALHGPANVPRHDHLAARRRAILEGLGAVTQLRSLELRRLQVTSLAPLEHLGELHSLWLDAPEVESLEPLTQLESLTYVGLYESALPDDDLATEIAALGRLPRLESLTVLDSPHDTSYLRAFPHLAGLLLAASGGDTLDLAGVAQMPELSLLHVQTGQLESLVPLRRARALRNVILDRYVRVPDREVEALRRARPELSVVRYPPPTDDFGDVPELDPF